MLEQGRNRCGGSGQSHPVRRRSWAKQKEVRRVSTSFRVYSPVLCPASKSVQHQPCPNHSPVFPSINLPIKPTTPCPWNRLEQRETWVSAHPVPSIVLSWGGGEHKIEQNYTYRRTYVNLQSRWRGKYEVHHKNMRDSRTEDPQTP